MDQVGFKNFPEHLCYKGSGSLTNQLLLGTQPTKITKRWEGRRCCIGLSGVLAVQFVNETRQKKRKRGRLALLGYGRKKPYLSSAEMQEKSSPSQRITQSYEHVRTHCGHQELRMQGVHYGCREYCKT
jgi:hypothetical protein